MKMWRRKGSRKTEDGGRRGGGGQRETLGRLFPCEEPQREELKDPDGTLPGNDTMLADSSRGGGGQDGGG